MAHRVYTTTVLSLLCLVAVIADLATALSNTKTTWIPRINANQSLRDRQRLQGGNPKDRLEERFPYRCSVRHRGSRSYICSGFLIRPEWVVTAASCVDPMVHALGLQPLVYCGAYRRNDVDRTKLFVPIATTMHPMWSGDYRKGFDVALLKLDKRTEMSQVTLPEFNKRTVSLPSGTSLTSLGRDDRTSGDPWDGQRISKALPYITPEDCQGDVPFNVLDHMICVGNDKNGSPKGKGVVGGVLMIPDGGDSALDGFADLDYVLGVASGHIDGGSKSTGVYTSIAHFWNWIEHVVDGKPISSKELLKPTPFLRPQKQWNHYADLSGKDLETVLKTVIEKIESRDAAALRKFLRGGLNPDSATSDDGWTLLHWAARHDSPTCIEVLIEYGAHVDTKEKTMRAPLSTAARCGSMSAVKVLLTHWADIEASDKYQRGPLMIACIYLKWDVAEFLISKGANIRATDKFQRTSLHYPSEYGAVQVVKHLISKGARVDAKDFQDKTPLWFASYYASLSNAETVKALLDAGASKTTKAKSGTRPYDVVCTYGSCSDAYKKQLRDLLNPTSRSLKEAISTVPAMLREDLSAIHGQINGMRSL